jgi:hypothetical protein
MIHHSQSDRWLVEVGIEVVDLGVLTHQPADCPEAEARHGQTGSSASGQSAGWAINDPNQAVRSPTISLTVAGLGFRTQTGSGGSWLVEVGIEVVDLGVLTHQPADCPEAELPD